MPGTKDLGSFSRDDGPLLVFGGPYSNMRATQALRAEAHCRGIPPERTICTGDIVAYCAEPQETVGLIRDWGCHVIQGNCEEQLAGGRDDCGCGFEEGTECDVLAKGWYPFAQARVAADDCAWMATLPSRISFSIAGISAHVLHGGTDAVSRFVFASEPALISAQSSVLDALLVIGGHAGLPFIERIDSARVWFNPGVIGMPANDGTADVWFGLITPQADGTVRLSTHRLKYDARVTAAAVRRWGYADGYARALVTGVWPSHDILPPAELAATGKPLRARSLTMRATRTVPKIATSQAA